MRNTTDDDDDDADEDTEVLMSEPRRPSERWRNALLGECTTDAHH